MSTQNPKKPDTMVDIYTINPTTANVKAALISFFMLIFILFLS